MKYFANNLADQLDLITTQGFCVMDNFLSNSTITALANEVNRLQQSNQLLKAGVGQINVTVNQDIRGDLIHWLHEADTSPAQREYFNKIESLRLALNQHLYLGLQSIESHLAFYPIGTGYKKHLDCFKTKVINSADQTVRKISCILYLNQKWQVSDGGHLRLYLDTDLAAKKRKEEVGEYIDIAPLGGRFVMFLSDTFYHEVLPATRSRISLTGWFLTR